MNEDQKKMWKLFLDALTQQQREQLVALLSMPFLSTKLFGSTK